MTPKPLIVCVDCGFGNCYERSVDNVFDIHCPDCGATFGWKNLPVVCKGCGGKLINKYDRGCGECSSCAVARWSPEKRAAINKMIGLAFRNPPPTGAETDAAVDEAFKRLSE